jgi:hypothetical protein
VGKDAVGQVTLCPVAAAELPAVIPAPVVRLVLAPGGKPAMFEALDAAKRVSLPVFVCPVVAGVGERTLLRLCPP